MDEKYGASWRRSEKDSRFHSRRKTIVDGIKTVLEMENCTEEKAQSLAQECQNTVVHSKSHNKFARLVKNMMSESHPFKHFDPADPELPVV
ncbi:hypothetical protein TRICI_003475 [Trichomonascus ciferrii]|uniref:Transcription activator GCR1-like domain-containing protein n=1 Tax=Trichomonascus ciferrii TaxID=44093 RepID=A0A642V3K9_9ASCO|nr:hypothetical protein TRICI_003475 [Trichomonascus ciferrii]